MNTWHIWSADRNPPDPGRALGCLIFDEYSAIGSALTPVSAFDIAAKHNKEITALSAARDKEYAEQSKVINQLHRTCNALRKELEKLNPDKAAFEKWEKERAGGVMWLDSSERQIALEAFEAGIARGKALIP